MEVLEIFNRYAEYGGEEKVAALISHEMGVLGHNIQRVEVSSEEWMRAGSPSRLTQLRRMFCNEEFAERLARQVDAAPVDALLLHNIYPVASPVVYRFAQERDLPLIQYIHNFRPFSVSGSMWANGKIVDDGLRGHHLKEVLAGSWQNSVVKSAVMAGVLWNLQRQGWLEAVTRWVAISDFMRDKFIEAGIPAEKVVTLRHSWDARKEENEADERDYYLYLSRLVPEKGARSLLAAWALLEKELGVDCPRLLIGGAGPDAELVKRAAEQSEKVEYLGFVSGEEKSALVEGCRAMLAPSVWWEPLGLVTYEAYDNGRPMIAARSGGLSETVAEGVTGFLHEPDDAVSLFQCLLQMEDLRAEGRREMGMRGRSWLLQKACPERWRSDFEGVLSSL